MTKILIIATSFPPIGERNCERVIKFCKYLPGFGYEPSVLTIAESNMRVFDRSAGDELAPDLKVHRVAYSAIPAAVTSLASRSRLIGFLLNLVTKYLFIPDDKIAWVLPAAFHGKRLCRKEKIAIIFSSAPSFSAHLAAYLIKRTVKCKWIADYRDLWTGNPNYKVKDGLRRKIEMLLDRLIVRNADAVVTVSEEWKEFIANSFLKGASGKVFVIPNGYDLSDFDNIAPAERDKGEFVISHTGVLMPSYPVNKLLEAIAGLDGAMRQRMRLEFFGYIYPDHRKGLVELSEKLGLCGIVRFGGSIPRKEALAIQKSSDLLLLMYSGYGKNVKGMIPSKLFDYIASGKPVLAILPECTAAEIINEGGCGTLVPQNDVGAIRVALAGLSHAKDTRSGQDYNWSYLKKYERREEAGALAGVCDGLRASGGKKILMIATDFPPNPSVGRLRTVKFCKYLPKFGWQPVVLAPSYRYFWGRDESLLKEIPGPTKVHRAFFPAITDIAACLVTGRSSAKSHADIPRGSHEAKGGEGSFKKRIVSIVHACNTALAKSFLVPDTYILWLPFAFLKALRIHRKETIDVIYTTIPAPSLVMLGYFLKKTLRKKWVIDYRDLWSGDHTREHLGAFRKKIERYLEKMFSSKADIIITTSPQKAEYLKGLLTTMDPDRIFCVTNGFDPDDYPVKKPRDADGRYVVTYTGRLYKKLSVAPFLQALGMAVNEESSLKDKVLVRLVGDIVKEERARIDAVIGRYQLAEMVDIVGYVSYQDSLRYQAEADLLLLIMGNAENADGVIPTKVFEYFGSGKPILAMVPRGAAEEVVQSVSAGITAPPDDGEAIKSAFLRMYRAGASGLPGLCKDEIRQFNREELTREMAGILSGIEWKK